MKCCWHCHSQWRRPVRGAGITEGSKWTGPAHGKLVTTGHLERVRRGEGRARALHSQPRGVPGIHFLDIFCDSSASYPRVGTPCQSSSLAVGLLSTRLGGEQVISSFTNILCP